MIPYIDIYNRRAYKYLDEEAVEIVKEVLFPSRPDWETGFSNRERLIALYEAGLLPPEYRYEPFERHVSDDKYMAVDAGGKHTYIYNPIPLMKPCFYMNPKLCETLPFFPYFTPSEFRGKMDRVSYGYQLYIRDLLAYAVVDDDTLRPLGYRENPEKIARINGWTPRWEVLLAALNKAMMELLLQYTEDGFEYAYYEVPCPFHLDHKIRFYFPIYEEITSLLHFHPKLRPHLENWSRYMAMNIVVDRARPESPTRKWALHHRSRNADILLPPGGFDRAGKESPSISPPHTSPVLLLYDDGKEYDENRYPIIYHGFPLRFYDSELWIKYLFRLLTTDVENLEEELWNITLEVGKYILNALQTAYPAPGSTYYDFYVNSLIKGYFWDTITHIGWIPPEPYFYGHVISHNARIRRDPEWGEPHIAVEKHPEPPYDPFMTRSLLNFINYKNVVPHRLSMLGIKPTIYLRKIRKILILMDDWVRGDLKMAVDKGYLSYNGIKKEPQMIEKNQNSVFEPDRTVYPMPPATKYSTRGPAVFLQPDPAFIAALGAYTLYGILYHLYRYLEALVEIRLPRHPLPNLGRVNPLGLTPFHTLYRYLGDNGIFSVGIVHYSAVFPIKYLHYWSVNKEFNEKYYRNGFGSPYHMLHQYLEAQMYTYMERRGYKIYGSEAYIAHIHKYLEILLNRSAMMVGYDPLECGATFEAVVYPGRNWYVQMEDRDKAYRWFLKPFNGEPGNWFTEPVEHGYRYQGFEKLPQQAYPNGWREGYILHRQIPFTEATWDREYISRDIVPQPLNIVFTYVSRGEVFLNMMIRKGELAEWSEVVKTFKDIYPVEPKIVKLKPEDIIKYYRSR